jgi:hypothetical protein
MFQAQADIRNLKHGQTTIRSELAQYHGSARLRRVERRLDIPSAS